MGPAGIVGGSLIAGSVFVVASASFSEDKTTKDNETLLPDASIVDVDELAEENLAEEDSLSQLVNRR